MNDKLLQYDIAIIGGGSAGLAAAVCCAKKLKGKKRIVVIEKENKIGKKLLATGNGKCNLTNQNMSSLFYNKSSRNYVDNVLKQYNTNKLITFWNSLGLICKADSLGRVYPYSGQASSVVDLIQLNLSKYSVDVLCETEIESIVPQNNGYLLKSGRKSILSDIVILSSGGKVQPNLGSGGASYKLARELNIKCTSVFPSLAPVQCSDKYLPVMKGVRAAASVSLLADEKNVHTENGELQINEKNISGICIFQLSRYVNEYFALGTVNGVKCKNILITADVMPDYTVVDTEELLKRRRKQLPNAAADDLFTGIINKKIGVYLAKKLNVSTETELYNITDDEIEMFAKTVKRMEFVPSGMSGINSAQVTAGGIELKEIDKNMQSVKYNNLYIIGEALDVDGMCGGYNLHWAFSSGIIAGTNAANTLNKR